MLYVFYAKCMLYELIFCSTEFLMRLLGPVLLASLNSQGKILRRSITKLFLILTEENSFVCSLYMLSIHIWKYKVETLYSNFVILVI